MTDADADGICDDVDSAWANSMRAASATGLVRCECGCSDIPEGDRDEGNQLDALVNVEGCV